MTGSAVPGQKQHGLRNADGVYEYKDRAYPSVTTVLDPYTNWLFVQLDAIKKEITRLNDLINEGDYSSVMRTHDEGQTWVQEFVSPLELLCDPGHIAASGQRMMRAAADRGSIVHGALELYAAGSPWGVEDCEDVYKDLSMTLGHYVLCEESVVVPYLRSLANWLAVHKPTVIYSETTVFSDEHKYAGTMDAIIEIEGRCMAIDLKSTGSMKRSYLAQVAAYRHADIAVPDKGLGVEVDMKTGLPDMELGILLCTPEKCGLRTVTHAEGEMYFQQMFLPALAAWWANKNLPMPKLQCQWEKPPA